MARPQESLETVARFRDHELARLDVGAAADPLDAGRSRRSRGVAGAIGSLRGRARARRDRARRPDPRAGYAAARIARQRAGRASGSRLTQPGGRLVGLLARLAAAAGLRARSRSARAHPLQQRLRLGAASERDRAARELDACVRRSLPRASRSSASARAASRVVGQLAEQIVDSLPSASAGRPSATSSAAASRAALRRSGSAAIARSNSASARLGGTGCGFEARQAEQRARALRVDLERALERRARGRRQVRRTARARGRARRGTRPSRDARAGPRRPAPAPSFALPGRGEILDDRRQRSRRWRIVELDGFAACIAFERRLRSAAFADPLSHRRHRRAPVIGTPEQRAQVSGHLAGRGRAARAARVWSSSAATSSGRPPGDELQRHPARPRRAPRPRAGAPGADRRRSRWRRSASHSGSLRWRARTRRLLRGDRRVIARDRVVRPHAAFPRRTAPAPRRDCRARARPARAPSTGARAASSCRPPRARRRSARRARARRHRRARAAGCARHRARAPSRMPPTLRRSGRGRGRNEPRPAQDSAASAGAASSVPLRSSASASASLPCPASRSASVDRILVGLPAPARAPARGSRWSARCGRSGRRNRPRPDDHGLVGRKLLRGSPRSAPRRAASSPFSFANVARAMHSAAIAVQAQAVVAVQRFELVDHRGRFFDAIQRRAAPPRAEPAPRCSPDRARARGPRRRGFPRSRARESMRACRAQRAASGRRRASARGSARRSRSPRRAQPVAEQLRRERQAGLLEPPGRLHRLLERPDREIRVARLHQRDRHSGSAPRDRRAAPRSARAAARAIPGNRPGRPAVCRTRSSGSDGPQLRDGSRAATRKREPLRRRNRVAARPSIITRIHGILPCRAQPREARFAAVRWLPTRRFWFGSMAVGDRGGRASRLVAASAGARRRRASWIRVRSEPPTTSPRSRSARTSTCCSC